MQSDYAKSAERHKKQLARQNNKKGRFPVLMLLLTLAAVCGLGWFLFQLTEIDSQQQIQPPPLTQSAPQREAPAIIEAEPEPGAQYDFYRLLPESSVAVQEVPEYRSTSRFSQSSDTVYLLQAGSFRNREDANRLRGKLILEGLDVEVSSVTGATGVTWHRILVGPFNSRSELNRAQDVLAKANTESMLMVRKR